MAYRNMGRTSRYSRNSAISSSVSNIPLPPSPMGLPLWRLGGLLDRALLEGPEGDVADALEGPAMDRARPEPLQRVPVGPRPVPAVGVEPIDREPPVVPVHGAVPRDLRHDRGGGDRRRDRVPLLDGRVGEVGVVVRRPVGWG